VHCKVVKKAQQKWYVDPLDNHCHLCGMMSSVDDVTDLVRDNEYFTSLYIMYI